MIRYHADTSRDRHRGTRNNNGAREGILPTIKTAVIIARFDGASRYQMTYDVRTRAALVSGPAGLDRC